MFNPKLSRAMQSYEVAAESVIRSRSLASEPPA
jgi:hypothetical protein